MDADEVRALFASARVARLATVDGEGRPHLVAITFATDGEQIVTAVDHKPKRTTRLRRLANIEANPHVCVLADHYEDDWSRLWWARADGTARVVGPDGEGRERAVDGLVARYAEYEDRRPQGSVIVISVSRWSGWRAAS